MTIQSFEMAELAWNPTPVKAAFLIDADPSDSGGFRQAFKATSGTKGFDGITWVVKKYLNKTKSDIDVMGQTVEQHTKKTVQMHNLARNFAARLEQEITTRGIVDKFGLTLSI